MNDRGYYENILKYYLTPLEVYKSNNNKINEIQKKVTHFLNKLNRQYYIL